MTISSQTTTKKTWKTLLHQEKEKPYFQKLMQFIKNERLKGKVIYPKPQDTFNALKQTLLASLKVVILGQDPYHGPNQAHGLCFSVQKGINPPPSLKNIFKELQADLQIAIPPHGCLTPWANQGVLLLNSVLTVEKGKPYSHANQGWETFTDEVIQKINDHTQGVVFLLWGSHAQKKGKWINEKRHRILKSTHPSPLSANRGFLGCHHFSKTNAILISQGKSPIDWSLSDEP